MIEHCPNFGEADQGVWGVKPILIVLEEKKKKECQQTITLE
jgi:hypothetical protein